MFSRFLCFVSFVFLTAMHIPAQIPTIETGIPLGLAKWRAAHYSDARYKLNLTLEKMSPVLKGAIEIRVKNNADRIILDWRKIRGKEDSSTIANILVNGKPAKYEEANEHLIFKDGVIKGENVIKLDFTSPIATSGAGVTRYVDKEDGAEYVYSLFVPSDASTAFPVFDQPDLKAKFKLEVAVQGLAIGWKVVSNTPVKNQMTSANRFGVSIYEFEETKPISTYVFAFAAGDFAEFDENTKYELKGDTIIKTPMIDFGKEIPKESAQNQPRVNTSKIYVRKSQAEKFKLHAAEVFRLNREGVKFLEGWFDYKFPFPKYDLVLIPEFPFGGMEHAGATFLREASVIFPTEPTKNDYVSRANVIFHEAAHQWFGDTVTMKWFDDLWLKEGFAEFMAYKTLAQVMPEYNAWKIFYERNKQLAYLTDSTKGTTPIYQEIPNLSAAKSAYGNIVYRKAPSFLRQAEFYLGEDKFQTAVRAFLKKHEFANAEWTDLVKEFETASKQDLRDWANVWVKKRALPILQIKTDEKHIWYKPPIYGHDSIFTINLKQKDALDEGGIWQMRLKVLFLHNDWRAKQTRTVEIKTAETNKIRTYGTGPSGRFNEGFPAEFIFPNYEDYGYGVFLLDERSRAYVLANIQNEKDDFLRTMMWGALWDSVRETELAPEDYVALVIKNINVESDESTIQTLLGRVSTAMNYYLSDAQRGELAPRFENLLFEKMKNSFSPGERTTYFRAFLNNASSPAARKALKDILKGERYIVRGTYTKIDTPATGGGAAFVPSLPVLRTKDKFDIATRLFVLGDKAAPQLLAELEKTETSDEAKRYAYAAKAGIATAENKQKFYSDFVGNKEISESYIESAFVPFNSPKHAELTLPYLEKSLAELPNLKRNRKIFFVNGWLSAFIGGQRSEQALAIVNKFLADNPNLDKDLRLKILENVDGLERAVKIRAKYGKN